MSDVGPLDRIHDQVVDRERVDWDVLATSLGRSPEVSADDRAEVEMLRLLDQIAEAHFTLQSSEEEPVGEPAAQSPARADDDGALSSWGRYRLEEKVGRGGFGSVYRGWDPVLEMPVAIKILHRRLSDSQLGDRLLGEGRAIAPVKHPNVVRVLNVEEHDGRLGLVMEFLRGETLDAIVASHGALNDREATLIGEDVCRALAAVHAQSLLHRDIKARNVIRERAGRIVLMDFGAGLAQGERSAAVGTPLYMAPELFQDHPPSVASDIYGLGVLLFFLVTGRHPVEGTTIDDVRDAHTKGRRLSLLDLRPDLPVGFVAVVDRALAAEPDARYHSAGSLLQALAAAREAGPDWRRRLVRIVAAGTALAVFMTIGGMLSSAAFNLAFGRGEYANESILDWFTLGRRSLLLPVLLSLISAGVVALILAIRSIMVATFPGIGSFDRTLMARCHAAGKRLSLHDPAICACWLLVLTTIGATAIWLYWLPLLQAVTDYFSTVPAERLQVLSAPYVEYRSHYRVAMSFLIAANIAVWYALTKAATWRQILLPRWFKAGEIGLLVLLIGSMQFPYRIIHDNDVFPAVTWRDQSCRVLGERGNEALLFCPLMMPRNRIVTKDAIHPAASRDGEGLFEVFAPAIATK